MARFDHADVRDYYEANTPAFVAYGQGAGEGAIHRAVWGPGVERRAQAFHYVDDWIAELVTAARPATGVPHVVDLGCGVGASLCYLAARVPMTGTGVTLSPTQAALAGARIAGLGLESRLSCLEADYLHLPDTVFPADVAFAIESFVHAPEGGRFFAACAALVRPGGVLVICDDVRRTGHATGGHDSAAATVDRFCRGWRINTLLTGVEMETLASDAGFALEAVTDLTPWLALRRPRDRALAALQLPLGWLERHSDRAAALSGGSALHRCLVRGWVAYELRTFRRR